ncbi:MAG: TonB family protein [Gammaproteobacteria bacterium]|nr:TonB family protein [Gammaproteobacteria bacterium]
MFGMVQLRATLFFLSAVLTVMPASATSLSIGPTYPPDAVADCVSGWVELKIDLLTDGAVGEINVLASDPPGVFEHAALEYMRKLLLKSKDTRTTEKPLTITQKVLFEIDKDYCDENEKPINPENVARIKSQDSMIEPEDLEHSFSGEWQILDGFRKVCDGYLTRPQEEDFCAAEVPGDWVPFQFEGKTYYMQPLSGRKPDEKK